MNRELVAIIGDAELGRITQNSTGRLSFAYEQAWREFPDSYPLSLSMPLRLKEHPHERIEAFLWGLLPDNEQVLERWATRFQVSARNAFGLMGYVGEECAGAVQFLRPERLSSFHGSRKNEVQWLSQDDIAERLKLLRQDHSAWRLTRDSGQFSLAGAQPKTALLFRDGKWSIPSGRTPTTHILKPPTGEWDGHAENEHLCLELAARVGLVAAKSSIERFNDEVAIAIERYDRFYTASGLVRIHQEDMCQAFGLPPARKYESDGGPNIAGIIDLLRTHSTHPIEDVARFLEATAFNWLIGGTDAHAKNYSVLLGKSGSARLAPLYDVASILPYPTVQIPKLKMAMKVGGHYHLRMIGVRQWRKLAKEVHVDEDQLIQRLRTLASEIPDHTSALRRMVLERGLKHPLINRLAEALTKRAQFCTKLLQM
jgi:serine/threonine-protein kinase HipA